MFQIVNGLDFSGGYTGGGEGHASPSQFNFMPNNWSALPLGNRGSATGFKLLWIQSPFTYVASNSQSRPVVPLLFPSKRF